MNDNGLLNDRGLENDKGFMNDRGFMILFLINKNERKKSFSWSSGS